MIEKVSAQSTIITSRGNDQSPREIVRNEIRTNPDNHNQQNVVESKEEIETVVNSLNDFLQPTHTSLKFELHDKLNEYYVTIVDDTTREVVREIPSKKLLDMHAAMAEYLGLLVDKKI